MAKSYAEKLQHPKWQKKKNGILERDKYTCQMCYSTDEILHVHHIGYVGDPWEVEDRLLLTLCKSCHESETEALKQYHSKTVYELRRRGMMSIGLEAVPEIFDKDRGWTFYEPAYDILKMVVDDDAIWEMVETEFWKRLSEKSKERKKNG